MSSLALSAMILIDDDTPIDIDRFDHDPSSWDLISDDGFALRGGPQLNAALGYDPTHAFPTPLYTLRGEPKFVKLPLVWHQRYEETEHIGWLDVTECRNALTHAGIIPKSLHKSARVVFRTLDLLAEEYGPDRVIFLFHFG